MTKKEKTPVVLCDGNHSSTTGANGNPATCVDSTSNRSTTEGQLLRKQLAHVLIDNVVPTSVLESLPQLRGEWVRAGYRSLTTMLARLTMTLANEIGEQATKEIVDGDSLLSLAYVLGSVVDGLHGDVVALDGGKSVIFHDLEATVTSDRALFVRIGE